MRRNKFNAVPVTVAGCYCDSTVEGERYLELLSWQQQGKISQVQHHPVYGFVINGVQVTTYEADTCYRLPSGALVVEDVKSPPTAKLEPFRIKVKLMLACYGIAVQVFMPGRAALAPPVARVYRRRKVRL